MEFSSFLTGNDRSHISAEVMNRWMHWAQMLSKCLFLLLHVSMMKQSGPEGCTPYLLTCITSEALQEGGVGGYEKENGTEQKLGTKEDIQMTDYMFNSKCHKEVQIQTVRNHYIPGRLAKIQHTGNTKHGQGCGNKNSCSLLWECTLKTVWQFPTVNIFLPYDLAITFLGI